MPDWVKHAIWWQVYPLGFASAEAANEPGETGRESTAEQAADARPVTHRLARLADWLDYAVNLGASGVALGPVFASQTHGYDTTDHYRIDPRLGDEQDFAALAQAAHACGLRLLLDGVFNHVGRDFPAFRRVLEQGPSAPEASWFRLTWPPDAAAGTEPEYGTFEGHDALVALNHGEPAVARYVAAVMNHWLDAGADGWRLDAAYAVPAAFWAQVPTAGQSCPSTAECFRKLGVRNLGVRKSGGRGARRWKPATRAAGGSSAGRWPPGLPPTTSNPGALAAAPGGWPVTGQPLTPVPGSPTPAALTGPGRERAGLVSAFPPGPGRPAPAPPGH